MEGESRADLTLVSIGTLDVEAAVPVYRAVCGAEPGRYTTPDGTLKLVRFFLGDALVELMEPIGQPTQGMGAAVAHRLEKTGPGVHLVCLPCEIFTLLNYLLYLSGSKNYFTRVVTLSALIRVYPVKSLRGYTAAFNRVNPCPIIFMVKNLLFQHLFCIIRAKKQYSILNA